MAANFSKDTNTTSCSVTDFDNESVDTELFGNQCVETFNYTFLNRVKDATVSSLRKYKIRVIVLTTIAIGLFSILLFLNHKVDNVILNVSEQKNLSSQQFLEITAKGILLIFVTCFK